jgi:hypothetical protein
MLVALLSSFVLGAFCMALVLVLLIPLPKVPNDLDERRRSIDR